MKARAMWSFGSRIGLVALVAALMPLAAAGQSSDLSFGAGGAFELYSFSDKDQVGIESITLFTVPFGVRGTLSEGLDVRVTGNFARGSLTGAGGTESTLSGLTDTNVQLDYTIGQDAITLSGIFSIPTGSATHDAEESAVAGAVAADLLPFRITNWGTGGGIAFQAAGARRFESFGAGLSVAYTLAGEFEPMDGSDVTYAPGDELRVQLALDTELGQGGKGSLLVGFQNFSDDALDGTNIFQSGNRLNVTASYAFPAGYRRAGVFYGGVIHRENGTFLQGGGGAESPSQDLVLLGGQFRMPLGGNWIRPRVDARLFRTENGVGQGYVTGVGASMEIAGGDVTWIPTLTGRFGNVEIAEGQESSFTGLEAGLSLRFNR